MQAFSTHPGKMLCVIEHTQNPVLLYSVYISKANNKIDNPPASEASSELANLAERKICTPTQSVVEA